MMILNHYKYCLFGYSEKCDSSRSSPNIAIDEVHIHTNGPAQLPQPDHEYVSYQCYLLYYLCNL